MKHLLVLLPLFGLFGCEPGLEERQVFVQDDMFGEGLVSIRPFRLSENMLHDPYVAGTIVVFSIFGSHDTPSTLGWTLTSSDTSVMNPIGFDEVGSRVSVEALAPGQVTLALLGPNGRTQQSFEVEVGRATSIRILPDQLFTNEDPEAEVGPRVTVVEGGRVTFMVRYYDAGGTELRGRDVLQVRGDGSADMGPFDHFHTRLHLRPRSSGPLTLWVDGVQVGQLELRTVPAAELSAVYIGGEEEEDEMERHAVFLRALGSTVDSPIVYGISPVWSTDGERLDEHYDMFTYVYDRSSSQQLSVEIPGTGLRATRTIHADGARVFDSNQTCSAGTGVPVGFCAPVGIALALIWRRRKIGRGCQSS